MTAIEEDVPRILTPARTRTDRLYRGIATGAGSVTLITLVLIGAFLLIKGWPALKLNGWHFLTNFEWNPDSVTHETGVGSVAINTVIIAVTALVMAIPVCVLAAMFITEYAPRRFRRPLTSLIDLLAAIPAVIFGAWGFAFLQPHLLGVAKWLTENLGFIPFFKTSKPVYAASPFIVGCVVALMMLPTGTSVMREVFARAPEGEKEAVLALGGSRWRMMRRVVLPFGRSGIIGGSMLALGRAFGEAISVAIIISSIFYVNPHILEIGGNSIGALIANRFGDSTPDYGIPALMAAGLVLFLMTLLVNVGASFIVRRSRSGQGVN